MYKNNFERGLDPKDAMNIGKASKKLDYSEISNIEFENIDYNDSPDFCDVFISSADYKNREMTEDELEKLNEDSDFIHENLMKYLY
ncbi:MAG: hypothetical protein WC554_09765 [Clostridia bacterium]